MIVWLDASKFAPLMTLTPTLSQRERELKHLTLLPSPSGRGQGEGLFDRRYDSGEQTRVLRRFQSRNFSTASGLTVIQ
jgi:hypothetical protein